MLDYNISKRHLLSFIAFLQAALHHTTPMFMSSDLFAMAHTGFKYELGEGSSGLRPLEIFISWLLT